MDKLNNGIGQLNERTLHLVLKNMYEPNKDYHEQKHMGFVADIKRDNEIIEIETRSFSNLRKKLSAFLADSKVNVVYPIIAANRLIYIDRETGEEISSRKSVKKGTLQSLSQELYKIKANLGNKNLTVTAIFTEIEEYRYRIGKRRSIKLDRIPISFGETVVFKSKEDYLKLCKKIPESRFTVNEFSKINQIPTKLSWYILDIFTHLGFLNKYKDSKQNQYEKIK